MPFLLGMLAVAAAAIFWILRVRAAANAARELADFGDDVRAAVRRFGFQRSSGGHAVDKVDDSRLIAAAMLATVARLESEHNPKRWCRRQEQRSANDMETGTQPDFTGMHRAAALHR